MLSTPNPPQRILGILPLYAVGDEKSESHGLPLNAGGEKAR